MRSYSARKPVPPTVLSVRIVTKCRITVYVLKIFVGNLSPAVRKIIRLEKPCMNVFPGFSRVQDPQGIINEQLLAGWKGGAAGGDNNERAEERKMMSERDNDGHNPTPSPAFVWVGFFSSWLPCPPGGGFFFFSFFFLYFTLCCLPPAFCMGAIYFSLSNTVTLSPSH